MARIQKSEGNIGRALTASSWAFQLAFGKNFSTLLKTPFKAASKLGNNFTEHKTAIHTCSQCSHYLQMQLESTPVLHRVSHRFFPCLSQIVVLEVELGQDPIENA